MAQFMITVGDGANEVSPDSDGRLSPADEIRMVNALYHNLDTIAGGDIEVTSSIAFRNLQKHLENEGHFRQLSPRFESLRATLQ
jgi:hypothetical protein